MTRAEAEDVRDVVWSENEWWEVEDVDQVLLIERDPPGSEDWEVMVYFNSGAYLRVSDREPARRRRRTSR